MKKHLFSFKKKFLCQRESLSWIHHLSTGNQSFLRDLWRLDRYLHPQCKLSFLKWMLDWAVLVNRQCFLSHIAMEGWFCLQFDLEVGFQAKLQYFFHFLDIMWCLSSKKSCHHQHSHHILYLLQASKAQPSLQLKPNQNQIHQNEVRKNLSWKVLIQMLEKDFCVLSFNF